METRIEFTGTFTSCGRCLLPRSLLTGTSMMKRVLTGIASVGILAVNRRGGDRECTVLSPLRPCSNLYLACLYPPNPRLGSPRGRSAHDSVCRPEQSGRHRRWQPWLQSSPPALVRRRGIDHKQSLANVRFTPSAASGHEGGRPVG